MTVRIDIRPLVRQLLRANTAGTREAVLYLLLAQLLAEAAHDGPPHAARRPAGRGPAPVARHRHHESLTGRRPRG